MSEPAFSKDDSRLKPPRDPNFEEAIARAILRAEAGGEPALREALEELQREHPERADELRERVGALRSIGLLETSSEHLEFPERLGDFRLIERLGEGGMGVVFLAEQLTLGRRVALKLLRPERMWFRGARERFRREVEAIARLAHPGIVPVHTFGEEQGVPFYAMELVEGLSLAAVIEGLKGREPARLSGGDLRALLGGRGGSASSADAPRILLRGSYADACLSIAREVAAALQHAHERGVVHRDVKPSNVMLTASGRVLLLDFGLASLEGSERVTQSGAQPGSLAYMAPEQLEGRADEIGPATDVYALGVLLYELLTLRLPHRGASTEELALRIVSGEFDPPRRHNAELPADVETVLLTALDLEPRRRYPSAEAFARDLTNLLERRPIRARRASLALRARRFAQRHPGWTAAAGLAFLLVAVAPTLFALQQRAARVALAAENARAEENLASALDAVDFLTRVGQDELAEVQQAEQARRRLLEGALGFYERFAAQRGGERFRRERAAAEARVGDILGLLGRHAEARAALESAIAELEALRADDPTEGAARSELRIELAAARARLASALRLAGEVEPGLAVARAAAAELRAAVDEGADGAALSELARAETELGEWLVLTGDRAGAIDALQRASELWRPLAESGYASGIVAEREAATFARLAELELEEGRLDEAEAALASAGERLEALGASRSRRPRAREQLGHMQDQLAQLLSQRGDPASARAHAVLATELFSGLAAEFPSTPEYREQLGVAEATLGVIDLRLADPARSADAFRRSIEIYEGLCAEHPDTPQYRVQRATVVGNSIQSAIGAGRFEEAREGAQRALDELEPALRSGVPDAERTQRMLRLLVAQCLHGEDRFGEALDRLADLGRTEYPDELAFAAGLAAACAVDAARSDRIDSEEREMLEADGRALALELLRRAIDAGLRDAAPLLRDPRMASLRGEDGFRELFAELGAGE